MADIGPCLEEVVMNRKTLKEHEKVSNLMMGWKLVRTKSSENWGATTLDYDRVRYMNEKNKNKIFKTTAGIVKSI